jgi:hypothetical protein
MATLVLNHNSIQPHCAVFYRNGVKLEPRYEYSVMKGYIQNGTKEVAIQREGCKEIKDTLLLHFHEKPKDPWHLKTIWDYHTTPEELFKFFGYDINNLNGPIYINDIDPWFCFTETSDLCLYFGKDKPKLKVKSTKIVSKHAKIWAATTKWFGESFIPKEYLYWNVKDKSKLLFCGVSSIEKVFPEFDWSNIDPYGKRIDRIKIGVFRASDPYDIKHKI